MMPNSPTQPQHGMGYLPDLGDNRDFRYAPSAGPPPALPPRVDLRAQCPPVYNQGSIGSCSSNGVSAMFRFVDKKQGGQDVDPSRLFLYYEARKMRGWESFDSGSMIRDNLKVEADLGAAPENTWPYDVSKFTNAPPEASYVQAEAHQAIVYLRVDINLEAMKACLAAGYPFVVGSTLYANFYESQRSGIVPMPAGNTIGGHAMMYVGYDDVSRRFIVMNSWSTSWGDQGFVYMPYDYAGDENLSSDAWTIRGVEEVGPIPPEPPKPEPKPEPKPTPKPEPPKPTPLRIVNVKQRKGLKQTRKVQVICEGAKPDAMLLINSLQIEAELEDGVFHIRLHPGSYVFTVKNPGGELSPPFNKEIV